MKKSFKTRGYINATLNSEKQGITSRRFCYLGAKSSSGKMSDKMSDKAAVSDKNYREALLACIASNGEIGASEAATIIGRSAKTARRVLLQLVDEGLVTATGGNRNRKYKANR